MKQELKRAAWMFLVAGSIILFREVDAKWAEIVAYLFAGAALSIAADRLYPERDREVRDA